MPYALFSLHWISVIAVFAAVGSGLRLFPTQYPVRTHVVFALTAITLALFSHTMTMFYFIGSAKKVKEFTAEWEASLRDDLRQKMIIVKRKIFPHMTFVCLVLMAAFIIGGAVDAKLVDRKYHTILAYAALIYHVHVSMLEIIYTLRNMSFIDDVNRKADSASS